MAVLNSNTLPILTLKVAENMMRYVADAIAVEDGPSDGSDRCNSLESYYIAIQGSNLINRCQYS